MPKPLTMQGKRRVYARILVALSALLMSAGCKEAKPQPADAKPVATQAPAPAVSSAAPPPSPCPQEMAHVGRYCIDTYEAHLVRADNPDTVLPYFKPPGSSIKAMARSRAGIPPQGYINRADAAKACKLAGKRLCSAREWYDACIGSQKTRYPYGETEVAGRCNTGKEHLMQLLFGANTKYTYTLHYNNPRLLKEPGFLAKSGEYQGCVNDYGLHDMVGNLHEWVADDGSLSLSKKIPLDFGPELLGVVGSGVFMGGYFSSHGEHGRGCVYATATHAPDYHDYSTGFRCCMDEPAPGNGKGGAP